MSSIFYELILLNLLSFIDTLENENAKSINLVIVDLFYGYYSVTILSGDIYYYYYYNY